MELPPIDHAGWGRLLSAVLADNAAGTPRPHLVVLDDEDEARKRAQAARTTVHETSKDVYA